jgi:lipopolysaccharide export system protein LptC
LNAAKQAAWLFVALISLACSGWYYASSAPVRHLDDQTLSKTADMVINNLKVQQFDANGRLVNYLQTPLMHHVPLNNTHWLKNPHVIIAQSDQPTWEIQSQQATSLNGGESITFNKQVVIHQQKDEHTQESTLKTEAMTYFPKDKLAITTLDVTYEQPGTIVQSTGMKAYLAEKRVLLMGQTRSTYAPNRG